MLDGARETDLLRLRKSCGEVMAVGAAEALPGAMLGVTETGAKGAPSGRRARVWRERVTGVARAYVVPGR